MRSLALVRVRLLASTIAAFGSQAAYAQAVPLPSGGNVTAGSATIGQQGSTTTINQTSARAVIDWKNFSIGSGGTVNVLQPGSTSALLNRVTGNDVSNISGSLNANGQVFLVNRNGILIDPTGKIDAHGGFIASTLDIKNEDFMAGRLSFAGGGTGSVVNRGTIAGGAVALLGSRVANLGTIVSPMGRVGMGAAQQATLDLNGDGFLQVAIPSELGSDGAPLIDQRGLIDVGGGLVVLRAATAREIVRQTINMAGIIRATSVSRDGGTVVLDGGDGGTVAVSGSIDASGTRGGKIDVSGDDVALSGATIAATGSERGGLVRIGGAFQGGQASSATAASLAHKFTSRFGALDSLRAARTTSVDAASSVDASGGAAGGTVVVWSSERTRQMGTITAKGAVGGAVELSSKGALTTDLSRVTPGRGGALLLDPKNILVYDAYQFGSGTFAAPLTGSVAYGDNGGGTSTFNVADIKALMDGGTDVTLRASNDIAWSADLSVGFNANPGNLALSAGRSVSLAGYLTLNQANLSVVANDTLANGVVDADRDAGAGEINTINARISGGTASGWSGGNVSLAIGSGAGVTNGQAGDMRLSSITARSININAGSGTVSLFDFAGGINPAVLSAVDAVTLTGAIKVQSSGGLTLSGRTVNWLSETSSPLSATSPQTIVRFIENGVLTRYGVLNGGDVGGSGAVTDTTRLALGKGGSSPAYSATYGAAYGPFARLHLVSGALQGSDTLDTILASGATSTSGPAAGQGVGDYAVTTSATSGFGLASGVAGYFIDLRTATDTLRITPKALTATVTAGNYIYGSPTNVASLTGLVGSDVVGLAATVSGLGAQGLAANGSGYAFAPNLAAGQRSFTLTGLTGAAAANYTLDLGGTISAALDIARKSLVYVGTSVTSTYGTLNGASFNLAGALAGDDVSIGLGGISRNGITSTLTATTNVGSYTTIASALTGAAANNYVIDVAGSSAGQAIITPKALTYVTTDTSSTYGTLASIAAPTLTGVIAGDDVGATALLNNGNVAFNARTAAGNYNINAALTGSGAGNYILSGGSSIGVLRIGRLGLGVTLADASMVYSAAIPDLATLTGVLAGDDVRTTATIDNSFTNILPDAGTHQYQLTGITGADANNYFLSLPTNRTAILTVTPKPINYSINSQTLTYGSFGSFSVNLVNPPQYPLSASVVVTNVLTGASTPFDSNARLAAGTYTLTATALTGTNASNYMLADSGNQLGSLVINPKTISYSASSANGTYGDTLQAPFAVLNGAYSNDDVSANTSILSGSSAITLTNRTNAGTYLVTVTGLSGAAAGNYILSGGTDGLVTIAQRMLTYRVGDMFTTYGTLAPGNVTLTGVLTGDEVTPLLLANGQALTNRLNAGSYGVDLGGLGGAQGGNYSFTPGGSNATLYVRQAPLTYTLAAASSIYGNPLNLSTLVWSGMQLGESAPTSFNYLNDSQYFANVNAGTYTPTVVANINSNYYLDTVHSVLGQYTILRRSITLQALPVLGARGTNYGLVAADIKGVVKATGTVGSDGVALAVTPQGLTTSTGGYVNAGSYTLKISAAVGDLYGINYVVGSVSDGVFTVTPLALNPNGRGYSTSTYGTLASLVGAAPAMLQGDQVSFNGLGAYKDGQAVTLAAQTAAGDYSVRATSLTGTDAANYTYDFSREVGGLTIARKALTYNTGNLSTTYGTLAALGTATLSGLVGSDQVVGLNSIIGGYDARSQVGVRQFDAPTLTGAAASNYTLASGGNFNGYLDIAPKALSVTFLNNGPSSWTYGTTQDPTQFYQLNGVLSGDTVGATLLGQLTGTAAGNPLAIGSYYGLGSVLNAGTYVTSLGGGNGATLLTGASAGNYILRADAVTNASSSFTVTQRTISGGLSMPSAIIYGDAPAISVSFTNTVGSSPIGYAVNAMLGTTSRALGRATALPANLAVGTQQLSVTLAGLDSYNYLLGSPITGQVSITPKPVTIDQLANSVTYGLATGAVFSIKGLVAGDDLAPVVSFGGDTAARATTVTGGFGLPLITRDVGTYATAINALTGAAAGNYTLASYSGSLAVTPKTITYTSDGFAAQYGGLTLPSCASGCELSGKDNMLAYGKVTLNGALDQDLGSLQALTYLSIDGRSSAFDYVRNTAAGNYLQIVNGLSGSKAGNYVISQDGSKAGLVVILPAWVQASVTSGGRLYTNATTGTYVTLGTPGIVTVRRSDNIGAAGDSFLVGDRVNVVTRLVDAKGNIVDGSGTLQAGSYTINPLLLVGPEAANYRLVPEGGSSGSHAGVFTVSLPSIFNFSFLTTSPNGYYVPGTISAPPIAPPSTTSTQSSGSTTTSATAGITGGAGAGATGTTSITQTYADGSSISGSASGTVGAQAGYTPLSATASAAASGNVSLIINRGPVTINYGAFVDASAKVEVSLKDLTITAGGEVMAGVQEGFNAAGNLGSGMSGSTGLQAQAFATANGEATTSFKNGANIGTSGFIGVGASAGIDGSLTGGGVTGSLAATVYSPGSLYIGAKVESGYADHTLTVGLNLGISLLIGGVELSPKISFSTEKIEAAGSDFANAWVGLAEKMVGVYCDSACSSARAKIQADYDAQVKADTLSAKVDTASRLMISYRTPTLAMINYLQANPDVVHYAQEAQANGTSTSGTNAITSAVSNYQYLTNYLADVVSQEKALATRIANDPTSITAADLQQAAYLRTQEKAVIDSAGAMFNARVVVTNGQLTFG